MKKKFRDTAIFFTILYWLILFIVVFKRDIKAFFELEILKILLIIVINLILIALSKYLSPVFEFILKITKKIGSFIFALVSTIIFFLVLTPIALFLRLRGKQFVDYKIDKNKETYYENYKFSDDLDKQF